MNKLKQKYFTNKIFYQKVSTVAVPLALQLLLASAMGIIDTIMVSWINEVSAVGTAAQIDALNSTICYGAIGGISIFSAQFFGAKDYLQLKKTFGLSLFFSFFNAFFWFLICTLFSEMFMSFYISDMHVIQSGVLYLNIMKFSIIPSSIAFAFNYMYRSIQRTDIPLKISIICVIENALINYGLIFGAFGLPKMGIEGAALGTCISQTTSLLFYIIYSVKTKQPFIGAFTEMFSIPKELIVNIYRKVLPLFINEVLFGFGSTLFIKAFGVLGKDSMDVYYVGNQICNIFMFIVYGYGSAISALLGERLGQGKIEKAYEEGHYFVGLSFVLSIIFVCFMIVFAPVMVSIFALPDSRLTHMAILVVYANALKLSMRLFNFMIFSILRSGGDSKYISFLDSGILWIVGIPLAFFCVHILGIKNIALVLAIVQMEQLVRMILGMKRFYMGIWAKDLTKLTFE